MGLDLIVATDSRSGGRDGLEARAAAKLAGTEVPRRRLTDAGLSRPFGGVFERILACEGERVAANASERSGGQEQGPGAQCNCEGGTGSPALGADGGPGLHWLRSLAREHGWGMCNLDLGSCGAERHGRVLATARHGSAAARTPVTGVLASRVRHCLCYLQQKDGEVALMLTKGLGWRGL
jgi:hypothetical protein